MITQAALVRAAARIARVDAAMLDIAGYESPTVVYGLSDAAAADALAAIRSGRPPAGRLELVFEAPVPLADTAHRARLLFLHPGGAKIDERLERTLRVMAIEIGHDLDVNSFENRRPLHAMLGSRIEELAQRIDPFAEPSVVLEAPRSGNVPTIAYVNPAFEQFFGFTLLDVIGQGPSVLYGPITDLDRMDFLLGRVRAGHESRSPVVFYKRDGLPAWVDVNLQPHVEESGAVSFYLATLRDVTARKEFEAALAGEKRKLLVTLAAIGDGVITTVGDGRIDFVNVAARALFRIDHIKAYGEPVNAVVPLIDDDGKPIDLLTSGERDGDVRRGEARFGRGNGQTYISYVTSPIGSDSDGFVIVLRDTTEQKRLAHQLSYEASHDALTGLLNRRKFEEVLDSAVAVARTDGRHHTLAFLDLDRFKIVNDRCGHSVGDRVLSDIAQVFIHRLRGRDVLARLGGDEFAVLLQDCTLSNARRVLEKLRLGVAAYHFEFGGETFRIGVSIGIAPIEGPNADAETALSAADTACYAAKAAGRNVIVG